MYTYKFHTLESGTLEMFSYAINLCTARKVSHTLVYLHDFGTLTQKYEINEFTSCTKKNCALSNGAAFNLSSIIGNLMMWPSWGC